MNRNLLYFCLYRDIYIIGWECLSNYLTFLREVWINENESLGFLSLLFSIFLCNLCSVYEDSHVVVDVLSISTKHIHSIPSMSMLEMFVISVVIFLYILMFACCCSFLWFVVRFVGVEDIER